MTCTKINPVSAILLSRTCRPTSLSLHVNGCVLVFYFLLIGALKFLDVGAFVTVRRHVLQHGVVAVGKCRLAEHKMDECTTN